MIRIPAGSLLNKQYNGKQDGFFCGSQGSETFRGIFFPFFWGIFFHFKLSVLWEAFSVKIVGSIARNDPFGCFFCENCRKHRAKRSFWMFFPWKLPEASHETIILEPSSVKIVGSFARNARFGSFFCEILKQPRTKRSFWNLLLWKLSEASHETLVLEVFSVKFWSSLARNARFGTFLCEIWMKPRTKRSFWNLLLWKLSEASHETLVLEAFPVKFGGSLARNDHFGTFFCENCRKLRTKRSFWKLFLWNLETPRTKRSFWKLFLYWSSTGVALCSSRVVLE